MRFFFLSRTNLFAALSGLLLALSFPRPDLAEFAWFGLVPLLLVMKHRPFRSGFIAGAVFFGIVLYWLNIVMTTYGHLHPILSVAAYLMLVAYLSLFWGTASWAACRIADKLNLSPVLTLPVLWVSLEFLRSFLLTGFPWATLGYSQQSRLLLIQSADLFGVYGISFLLVLSNAVLAEAVKTVKRERSFPVLALTCLVFLFCGNFLYGWIRLKDPWMPKQQVSVALVQGNIDQGVKWNPDYQEETINIYRQLTLQVAGEESVDLMIWPESAIPFYFQEDSILSRRVRRVPLEVDSYLLFGSPAFEVVNRENRYLNSAFLLSPSGGELGRSDKIHLVPFGEYVPLKTFLPFIDKMVVGIGDFSSGTVTTLPLNGGNLGVLVCFEGIFPELARALVQEGSDLLVNITNDAWFGRSSAPYQHLAMTRFRAIENRIWVARAANTGISAFIAPQGHVVKATPIFERAVAVAGIGLGAGPSLYRRIGDALPVGCLIISLIWLIGTRRRFRGNI